MARQMLMRLHCEDLIIDSFAGGGGASHGIEMALGRSPDIAINHDPEAIAMHAENHPATRHLCESVLGIDPLEATQGRRVALAWFSPDCKHFSKAKGGKPRSKAVRGLAWVVITWAKAVRPRVICLENVEEFQSWGPLLDDGTPDPSQRSATFRRWVGELEACGYRVEWRELRACDYGAPTSRKRLFVIARCDGEPIAWPEPTHGPGREPYRVAAECISWDIGCPSIFERAKPLAEKTLARIGRGIGRFAIDCDEPFIAPIAGNIAAPTLIQTGYGERRGQVPRVPGLHKPMGTIVAGGIKHALVAAFLAKHYGGVTGSPLHDPMHTVTAQDHHALVAIGTQGEHAERVRAFLMTYYGQGIGGAMSDPMRTVTARDRFGLVTVAGRDHAIADIGMRMLVPRELYRAQGFPDSYRIDFSIGPKPLTKTAQVRMAGNSVCPPLAAAIVRANVVTASARADLQEVA